MNKEQSNVVEFMVMAGQHCPAKPTMPDLETRKLRVCLIAEELQELAEAFNLTLSIINGNIFIHEVSPNAAVDLIAAHDATTDLKVVVIGTDVAMGIDNEPGWNEVHRSNMSKFIDGHRREDGKWIKGPSYSPANLKPIIEVQMK